MHKTLLAGLSDQEAAAVEIMLGMTWHDVQCVILQRSRWSTLPFQNAEARACHHCVMDFSGLGLGEYSNKHAASLLKFLNGRSAVLIVSGDGRGWLEADLALERTQRVVWVRKPYRSAELREALQYIKPAGAPASAAARAEAKPRARNRPSVVPFEKPAARARPETRDPAEMIGVTKGAFDMLLQAMPRLRQLQFMHVIGDLIKQPGTYLIKLGPATLLADSQAGWMITRFPLSILPEVLGQPQWVSLMKAEPVPPEQVEETIHQSLPGPNAYYTQGSLEHFVWELASTAVKGAPLEALEDVYFKVQRFPNFTKLDWVSPQEVRLAAICARAPRSVYELLRAFPHHEQEVLRFVVTCVISGAGVVSWSHPGAASAGTRPRTITKKRRGFLKLLLDKVS